MKQTQSTLCFNRGQALTEVLISMLVFAPMFLMIPVIGKYLDVKQKTIEASRYAVWERSVWADPDNSWNSGEKQKSNEAIGLEVDRRFFGHLSQLISDKSAYPHQGSVVNPMWNTTNTKIEMLEKNAQQNNNATVESYLPILNGVKGNSKTLRAYTEMKASDMPGDFPLIGVDQVASLMDIKVKDFITVTVSTPIKNHSISDEKLIVQAKSALLTNTWSVPDKKTYKQRVDDLVLGDEVVDIIIKVTGNVISLGGAIAIGLYYPDLYFLKAPKIGFLKTDVKVDSTDLPKHLVRKKKAKDEDKNASSSNSNDKDKKSKEIVSQNNNLNTYNSGSMEERLLAFNSPSAKAKSTASGGSNISATDINTAIKTFEFLTGDGSSSNTYASVSDDEWARIQEYQNLLNSMKNLDIDQIIPALTMPSEIDLDTIKQQAQSIAGSYGGDNIGCSDILAKAKEGSDEISTEIESLNFIEEFIMKLGMKVANKALKPFNVKLGDGASMFNC